MNREKISNEMQEMFGLAPTMYKSVQDSSLQLEWQLFKTAFRLFQP
jgi:hypothetical protein